MNIFFKKFILLFLTISSVLILSSCSKEKASDLKTEKQDDAIHKTFEKGPVSVFIDISHKEITIADSLTLNITVDTREGYEAELPSVGEKLESFGIKDYHTMQPELIENNKTRISRSYVLDPFLSGEYVIPPMEIRFWKKGGKEKKIHTIETEELKISVRSILPDKMKDLKIHDIMGPCEFPFSYKKTVYWTLAILLPFLLLLTGFFVWKRRLGNKIQFLKQIPAHEIAYAELEALVAKELIEKGEIKLFYQGISNILRRYIENRFGIHAPEQTTEEFMEDLKIREDFPEEHKTSLKAFLKHCDLVKFAEHIPTNEDIQNTFDESKSFIESTRQTEEEET